MKLLIINMSYLNILKDLCWRIKYNRQWCYICDYKSVFLFFSFFFLVKRFCTICMCISYKIYTNCYIIKYCTFWYASGRLFKPALNVVWCWKILIKNIFEKNYVRILITLRQDKCNKIGYFFKWILSTLNRKDILYTFYM